MKGNFTVQDLKRLFANPFYCINIHPQFGLEHECLVSREDWVKSAKNSISQNGLDEFLENLLDALQSDEVPLGYTFNNDEK